MKKYKTFSENIIAELRPYLAEAYSLTKLPKGSPKRVMFEKRTIAGLMGESLPDDHLPLVPLTPRKIYIKAVFTKYTEIKESIDRMKLSELFIRRIVKSKEISKLNYLKYHYENYLSEIFIYRERINSLIDYTESKCQKAGYLKEVKVVREVRKQINNAMEGVINIRGSHIHKKRYNTTKLDQIHALNVVSDNFDFIRDYRDAELKNLQKKFVKDIKTSLATLEDFIEKYIYLELKDIIFKKLFPK